MAKYFDNDPFLDSIPGNGNMGDNSGLKIALTTTLVILIVAVAGFAYRCHIDRKIIVQLKKEKDEANNDADNSRNF